MDDVVNAEHHEQLKFQDIRHAETYFHFFSAAENFQLNLNLQKLQILLFT